MELTINYERYNLLYNRTSYLSNLPIKYLFTYYLLFHVLMHIPEYFAFEIIYTKEKNSYSARFTNFGKTQFYNIYVVLYAGIYYFIIFFGLIILNGLNLRKYRKFLKYRKHFKTSNKQKLSRKEKTFTLMIIITTSSFILTMIFNFLAIAQIRLFYISGVLYNPIINIVRAFNYWFVGFNYLMDPFVYLIIDVNLRKIFFRYIQTED